MIINNFELIKPLLRFPTKDELKERNLELNADYFYVVQIIQRVKDNPTKLFGNPNHRNNSNKALHQVHIYSVDDFVEKMPTLIELAHVYQSRVYINLNLKSSYTAYVNLMKNMACRLETKNYLRMSRIYNEAVGECKGSIKGYPSMWIVDIDQHDDAYCSFISKCITYCLGGGFDGKGQVYAKLPTLNGFHLITSSFNLDKFNSDLGKLQLNIDYPDVHKDNPTVLWASNEWSLK